MDEGQVVDPVADFSRKLRKSQVSHDSCTRVSIESFTMIRMSVSLRAWMLLAPFTASLSPSSQL